MTDNELLKSEVALIRRIVGGETELYYQLIRPYQRMIYAAAFSILRDETDAEDVVQQTFLNGLAALRSFRAQSRISTWLTQIAINEARMRLRKTRHHRSVSIEEASMTVTGEPVIRDLIEWKRIPSNILEQEETRKVLISAFESLPRIYREVFVLRDVEGLSIAETAQVLGIQQVNVKTRLSRARMKMRELISDRLELRLQCAVLTQEKTLECKVVWQEASNFIDDEIAKTLRARIAAHLRICRGCKSVIVGIRNVIRLMGDPRALPLPLGFSLRLQKRLRSHFSTLKSKHLAVDRK
jgi:RNA polymerase sigma-70 factor, ECF subfamily